MARSDFEVIVRVSKKKVWTLEYRMHANKHIENYISEKALVNAYRSLLTRRSASEFFAYKKEVIDLSKFDISDSEYETEETNDESDNEIEDNDETDES